MIRYTRELETPAVREAAKQARIVYSSRLDKRRLTGHVDTIIDDPYVEPHRLREVPKGTYFTRQSVAQSKIELCLSKRSGEPIGKAFCCREDRFDQVIRDRHIFPVIVAADSKVVVYQVSPEQWRILSAVLSKPIDNVTTDTDRPRRRPKQTVEEIHGKDGLNGLHGKRFGSFRDLGSAFAAHECGLS